MAITKQTPRKRTGPRGVPRHQLAPRNEEPGSGNPGEGSSRPGDAGEGCSHNPNPYEEIAMLKAMLNLCDGAMHGLESEVATLQRAVGDARRLRDEAWAREDQANARVDEMEFHVQDVESDNAYYCNEIYRLQALLYPDPQPEAGQNVNQDGEDGAMGVNYAEAHDIESEDEEEPMLEVEDSDEEGSVEEVINISDDEEVIYISDD